jgi:hypothetical protein
VKGIRYNLAVELAGAHGILNELAGERQRRPRAAGAIRAALIDIDNLRCDNALTRSDANRRSTTTGSMTTEVPVPICRAIQ